MRRKLTLERDGWWLALAASLLISLPYLLSSQSFFSSDDWVHLRFNRPIPPWEVWRYFSPRVIWFYRPLQALQFGWLYHAVGLRPFAYNLSLFVMHLGVCLLVYLLAGRLVTPGAALLTTVLFAAQWAYVDVLLWPSNFSTLHWALLTLGLCILFLRYLESRRPSLLVGVYALLMLDFIAKEQAVCAPLLLGALWWWHQLAPANPRLPGDGEGTTRATLRDRLWEGARLIGPAGVLTLAFVWAHAHLIHDIYQGYGRLYYRLVPPGEALRQTLFAFNHVLLSFHRDPVVLPLAPPVLRAVRFVVEHFLALPLLLGALAWWRHDRTLGLGIFWIFLSLVPVAWLLGAHTARFYYLPAFGSALILAHSAQCCWRAAVNREERAARPEQRSLARCSRMGLVLSLIYVLIVNLSMITLSSLRYRDDSDLILAAFSVLREQAPRVPRGSLVVMRNLPASCFVKGAGLPDMVRIALRDRTAHAVLEGQILPYEWLDRLHQIPAQYMIDFSQHPLALRPIGDPDATERNAARPREPGSSASRSGEPSPHQRA